MATQFSFGKHVHPAHLKNYPIWVVPNLKNHTVFFFSDRLKTHPFWQHFISDFRGKIFFTLADSVTLSDLSNSTRYEKVPYHSDFRMHMLTHSSTERPTHSLDRGSYVPLSICQCWYLVFSIQTSDIKLILYRQTWINLETEFNWLSIYFQN